MILFRNKNVFLPIKNINMSKTGNALAALVVGAAIGVGIGILFAPDEGKKTRKRIRKSLEGVSDNLRDKLVDLNENLKEKKIKLKGTLEENVEKLLSKSSYKAEELINALERKLEDLKKANAKFQK